MSWKDEIKKNNPTVNVTRYESLVDFLLHSIDKDIEYIENNQELNREHMKKRLELYKEIMEKLQW